jgi:hypothetical protein
MRKPTVHDYCREAFDRRDMELIMQELDLFVHARRY